ncbi:hypothetical protein DdX_19992 [Ditylenchus destructor]|uniref:Uncharacterized protein n=1 Tax=Ditylenchus destructor TaxID=166010 RepID=A0AAD4MIH7_9BILA|nr:hypothetical protein DdX_19992 [Ditylenchus destructor]
MHSLLNTKRYSPLRKNNLTEWRMPSFPPKDVVKRTIDALGCRIKFDTVTRNCQHFVFTIIHGIYFSPIGGGYSCFNKDKFRNHSFHNVLPGSAKLKQLYCTKGAPRNSVFIQVHGEAWVNVIEDFMPTLIIDTETNIVDFSVTPPEAWDLNLALLKFIHEKVKEVWTLKLTKDGQTLKEPALRNALNALTVLEWNFLVQQMYTVVEVALELQSTALKPLKNTYPQLAFTRSESLVEALKACHKYWDMSGVDKKLKQVLKNLVGESQSNSLKYPLSGLQYIAANQFGVIDKSETGRWDHGGEIR